MGKVLEVKVFEKRVEKEMQKLFMEEVEVDFVYELGRLPLKNIANVISMALDVYFSRSDLRRHFKSSQVIDLILKSGHRRGIPYDKNAPF